MKNNSNSKKNLIKNIDRVKNNLLNQNIPLSSILTESYILARKLNDPDLLKWIKNEKDGYNLTEYEGRMESFPDYRRPRGFLEAQGPCNIRKPVYIPDEKFIDTLCRPCLDFSIANIEAYLKDFEKDRFFCISLHSNNAELVRKAVGFNVFPYLRYTKTDLESILNDVRRRLLEHILSIEEQFSDLSIRSKHGRRNRLVRDQKDVGDKEKTIFRKYTLELLLSFKRLCDELQTHAAKQRIALGIAIVTEADIELINYKGT